MFALKNVKLIVLAIFLVASVFLVATSFVEKRNGVVVSEMNVSSSCVNVKVGDIITQISGAEINNVNDFDKFVSGIKGGNYVNMVVGGGPANCVALKDGDLGVQVKNIRAESLRFGTDIAGGSVFIFKTSNDVPENITNEIVKIIEKRIKFFDLPQTKVYRDGNLVKIESFKDVDLNRLTMVGKIDTKIIQEIILENGTGKIKIGSESFGIKVNGGVKINDVNHSVGDTFTLSNITFSLTNATKDYVIVTANVYSNNDIETSQAQFYGAVEEISKGVFQFAIPVKLFPDASNGFSSITRGMGISTQPGKQSVLNGKIIFYVDDYPMTIPLDIPVEYAGKDIGVLIGFEKTQADANKQMKNVQAILTFGQLPNSLVFVKEEGVKPNIGIFDFEVLFAVLLISLTACIIISQTRYKKVKLGVYMISLAVAELICIIGVVVFFQRFSSYIITIDFSMFAGLVVASIFTMVKMLISTEESEKKSRLNIVRKYKKIISLKNLSTLCLILISISSFLVGYSGFGYVLLIGLVINVVLPNLIYKDLLKKISS